MHNVSCENEFYLHENEKRFPYQRLSTYPRFETEPRGTRKWPIYRSSTGVPELRVLIVLLKHLFMYVFNLSVLVQVEAGPCPNVRNIKWKVGKCDECYCRYTVVFCPLSCVNDADGTHLFNLYLKPMV